MSELAILGEWTFGVLKIMLAELSFIFLLESIELSLISIEVVIVGLLSKMPHDFARWVVEVPWTSLCVVSLTLIPSFFPIGAVFQRVIRRSIIGTVSAVVLFGWVVAGLFQVDLLVLFRSLRIWSSFLLKLSILSLVVNVLLLLDLLLFFGLILCTVTSHSSNPFVI